MHRPISVQATPEMRVERDTRNRAYAAYWQLRTAQAHADLMDLAIREWQRYAVATNTSESFATLFISTCEATLRSLTHRAGLRLLGSDA